MIEKLKRYSHIWILSYAFIYLPWFSYLEKTVTRDYYVIHTALDDLIPFSEVFYRPLPAMVRLCSRNDSVFLF